MGNIIGLFQQNKISNSKFDKWGDGVAIRHQASTLQKVAMFILAAYPVLNAYIILGNLTIANCACCLLFLFSVFSARNTYSKISWTNVYPLFFLIFWGYAAFHLIAVSSEFQFAYLFPGGINLCLYAISLGVLCIFFDFSYLYKYIRWIFVFATILFIYQLLIYQTTGARVSVFLPLSDKILYSVRTYQEVQAVQVGFEDRFSSIFLEPSYYGQYALFTLVVELLCEKNRSKLFTPFALFVLFISLFIKSGVGLVGLIVIVSAKLYYLVFKLKQKKYYAYLPFLLPLVLYGVVYYLNSEVGSGISSRIPLALDSSGEFSDQSANERILYGFWEYDKLDVAGKIFGASSSKRMVIGERNTAINGFSDSLITYGWVGTILLLLLYIKACYKKKIIVVTSGFMLLMLSFVETILFDDYMLLYSVIIFSNRKNLINV